MSNEPGASIAASQPCTRGNGRPGIRQVLEELHARDDVECARCFRRKIFDGDQAVFDFRARFELMETRDAEPFFR